MGSLMELRRRMIMTMNNIPDYLYLPSDYERIPYITANGNQAIRTMNYIPMLGDEFHMRFKGAGGTPFSAGVGTYQTTLIGGFSDTGWYCRFFSSATYEIRAGYSANNWYNIDISSTGTLTTNGQTFLCSP